jgi:hypothetical protein
VPTIPGTHDREEEVLDTPDPGRQIAEVESQVEALRRQLQDTDERFRAATGRMLSEWYWKEAERSATHENPERALRIGAEGINALQEELHKATDELRGEIGERLSLARPSEIGRELREMTGPLGRILESHGIISPGGPGYEGLWAYLGRATSGSPTYDGELLWTDEMSAAKGGCQAPVGRSDRQDYNTRSDSHRRTPTEGVGVRLDLRSTRRCWSCNRERQHRIIR